MDIPAGSASYVDARERWSYALPPLKWDDNGGATTTTRRLDRWWLQFLGTFSAKYGLFERPDLARLAQTLSRLTAQYGTNTATRVSYPVANTIGPYHRRERRPDDGGGVGAPEYRDVVVQTFLPSERGGASPLGLGDATFSNAMYLLTHCALLATDTLLATVYETLARHDPAESQPTITPYVPYAPTNTVPPGRIGERDIVAVLKARVPGPIPFAHAWATSESPRIDYQVRFSNGLTVWLPTESLLDPVLLCRLENADPLRLPLVPDGVARPPGVPVVAAVDDGDSDEEGTQIELQRPFPEALLHFWKHHGQWARYMEFARRPLWKSLYEYQLEEADAASSSRSARMHNAGKPYDVDGSAAHREGTLSRKHAPRDADDFRLKPWLALPTFLGTPSRNGVANYRAVRSRDETLPAIDAAGSRSSLRAWLVGHVVRLNRSYALFGSFDVDDKPTGIGALVDAIVADVAKDVYAGMRFEVAVYHGLWALLDRVLGAILERLHQQTAHGRALVSGDRDGVLLCYVVESGATDAELVRARDAGPGEFADTAKKIIPVDNGVIHDAVVCGPLPFWSPTTTARYRVGSLTLLDEQVRKGGRYTRDYTIDSLTEALYDDDDDSGPLRVEKQLFHCWARSPWAYQWNARHAPRLAALFPESRSFPPLPAAVHAAPPVLQEEAVSVDDDDGGEDDLRVVAPARESPRHDDSDREHRRAAKTARRAEREHIRATRAALRVAREHTMTLPHAASQAPVAPRRPWGWLGDAASYVAAWISKDVPAAPEPRSVESLSSDNDDEHAMDVDAAPTTPPPPLPVQRDGGDAMDVDAPAATRAPSPPASQSSPSSNDNSDDAAATAAASPMDHVIRGRERVARLEQELAAAKRRYDQMERAIRRHEHARRAATSRGGKAPRYRPPPRSDSSD